MYAGANVSILRGRTSFSEIKCKGKTKSILLLSWNAASINVNFCCFWLVFCLLKMVKMDLWALVIYKGNP